jgi:hypothetical protein
MARIVLFVIWTLVIVVYCYGIGHQRGEVAGIEWAHSVLLMGRGDHCYAIDNPAR